MTCDPEIPELHRAIAVAAVRAVLGERAVIRDMKELPVASLLRRAGALKYGICTFWNRWTARQGNGSLNRNETPR